MSFRIHFFISRAGSPNLGPLNRFETIFQSKSNDIHLVLFQQFSEIRKIDLDNLRSHTIFLLLRIGDID